MPGSHRTASITRGSWMLAGAVALSLNPGRLDHSMAWGSEGHRIVARLAYGLLTPDARKGVNSLLQGQGIASIATWADDIRNTRPKTKPLHFVNIPVSAQGYDSARDCAHGNCVVWAVEHYREVLADVTAPKASRIEALKFLVHFVGDLHQPLHCTDQGDRGGNEFPVSFFGNATELHAVWDSGLIGQAGMSENHYVGSLRARLATADTAALAGGTVEDWVNETHQLGVQDAYDSLHHGAKLGEQYFDGTAPDVDDQLLKAAVRLARMLNEALG